MRKRIISAILMALTGVLIVALLNVNLLVQRNKDFSLSRIGESLGRKVSADKIEVTLIPLTARMVNLTLADDPAFSAGDLLRAKEFQAELRLLPLLIGQLRLKKLTLVSPQITIVRDADGRYNFESRGGNDKNAERGQKPLTAKRESDLPAIASLNISAGTLRYRDLKTGTELAVTEINFKVSDIESDEAIEFQLDAAVMAAKTNLKFYSRIGPIAGIRDHRDFPIDGAISAEGLDLGKINAALPQFRRSLPRHLRFDGIYDIKDLKFKGTLNRLALKGAISGTDASVRFE